MRERQQVTISRVTGDAVMTTEVLPAADWDQRVAELKANGEAAIAGAGGGPPLARVLTVQCDGCGESAELDYGRPELPAGWAEREDGEFCPGCVAR